MAFLCVSQQGEFKNTIKNFLGKVHGKNFWPKKLRKETFICMRSPKTPLKYFLKSDLKISKNLKKR